MTPPLDRAALDGVRFDHVALDVHVGSIASPSLLEARGPLVSLHGHVHEAARLTGTFRTRLGRTHAFTAAHDGPELALVRFAPEDPHGGDARAALTSREPPDGAADAHRSAGRVPDADGVAMQRHQLASRPRELARGDTPAACMMD